MVEHFCEPWILVQNKIKIGLVTQSQFIWYIGWHYSTEAPLETILVALIKTDPLLDMHDSTCFDK